MLKGMWLKELGVEIGDYISVVCEDGKLIITPDTERAELEKDEVEILENERKAMKKRVKERRRELLERRVAESREEGEYVQSGIFSCKHGEKGSGC